MCLLVCFGHCKILFFPPRKILIHSEFLFTIRMYFYIVIYLGLPLNYVFFLCLFVYLYNFHSVGMEPWVLCLLSKWFGPELHPELPNSVVVVGCFSFIFESGSLFATLGSLLTLDISAEALELSVPSSRVFTFDKKKKKTAPQFSYAML